MNSILEATANDKAALLPVDRISVVIGHNPRGHFEQSAFDRLVDSVRRNGIISAITVRETFDEDGREQYELIAGERRLRAARAVGLNLIPATIRRVDEAEARRLALLENTDRADLSIPEEALAARRIVEDCMGDMQEAQAVLGWTAKKLQRRLLLLHASAQTLQALTTGQIMVQVAELLSSIPHDKQDLALPKIIELGLTVSQVREQVIGITTPLIEARFDIKGCAGCSHNSDVQASLFEAHVGAGRCSNRACFNDKSASWMETLRAEVEETYPSVALATEKEPGATVPLVAVGQGGVGTEQIAACKGCAHFGALIENRAGPLYGQLLAPTCFNPSCHAEKVAVYAQTLIPAGKQDDTDAETAYQSVESGLDATADGLAGVVGKGKGHATPTNQSKAGAISGQIAQRYESALLSTVAEQLKSGAAEPILALAAWGLATLAGKSLRKNAADVLADVLGQPCERNGGAHNVAMLSNLDTARLKQALVGLSVRMFAEGHDAIAPIEESVVRRDLAAALVLGRDWDVRPHLTVDAGHLGVHTKSGIEALLIESGFKAALHGGEGGERTFRALLAKGKADLIAEVLAAGYDFTTFRPRTFDDHAKALAAKLA